MLQGYKLQVQKLQENLAKAMEALEQTKQGALMVSGVWGMLSCSQWGHSLHVSSMNMQGRVHGGKHGYVTVECAP